MIEVSGINELLTSPRRTVKGRVALYVGATLTNTFDHDDALQSITVERMGEQGKFFGFGVCQKVKVVLRDKDRQINIVKGNELEISFNADTDFWTSHDPRFVVDEVSRDENTNALTITAYDYLYGAASEHKVSELEISYPYMLVDYADACARIIGLSEIEVRNMLGVSFADIYETAPNLEGTETIRSVLNAIAEATQTIYFIQNNKLVFKKLEKLGEPIYLIDKSQYFTLKTQDVRTLARICHATELTNDIYRELEGVEGETQYVRNNPFWDKIKDETILATYIDNAVATTCGISITPIECSWRGNFLLEIGDKIAFSTKDGGIVISYLLNDAMKYNGGLSDTITWAYEEKQAESAANPTNLGEALNQTYAKVDKVNKDIKLVVGEVEGINAQMSSIQMATDNISLSVQKVEQQLDSTNESMETLASRVDMAITADDVKIEIQNELENGVDKITTTTGFTFNEEGLTISKSESDITTQITENGMKIYQGDNSNANNIVLTADNKGVKAKNLHATTYLIIGTNSRIEDYGSNRTGCFWIGG